MNKPGAIIPYAPFPYPVPVPTVSGIVVDPAADTQSLYSVSDQWIPFVVGCAKALINDSTWRAESLSDIALAINYAVNVLNQLSTPIMLAFRVDPSNACIIQFTQNNGVSWSNVPSADPKCFAPGVLGQLLFRNNTTDPTHYDYSIDAGTTWLAMPDWQSHYVQKIANSTHDNLIEATGNTGLIIATNDNVSALSIETNYDGTLPMLEFTIYEGSSRDLIHVDDTIGALKLVNELALLQVRAFTSLPAPDSTHRGQVAIEQSTGVEDLPVIQLRQADGTYLNKSLIGATGATGADGLPGVLDLTYPAYGITNPFSFYMIVLADGSYLPYTFAAGDTLAITSLDGAWFVTDGTDDYIIDWAGTPAIISGIYQAGALLIEAYILDTNGKITFTEVSGLYTTPYVFAAGDHAVLGMNIPSGGAGQGYLLVKCEVTIAPVFDWTLVIPLQSGQPGVDITSAGYCSDQGTEGYGADTTVSNNITFQLHISGMDLATVCQQIDIEYTWLSFSTPSSVIELVFEGGYTVTIPVGSGYPASGSYSTGLITYNIGIGVGGYATAHLLNFALAIDYDHWAPNPKGVVAIKSVTLHGSGTPPTL